MGSATHLRIQAVASSRLLRRVDLDFCKKMLFRIAQMYPNSVHGVSAGKMLVFDRMYVGIAIPGSPMALYELGDPLIRPQNATVFFLRLKELPLIVGNL